MYMYVCNVDRYLSQIVCLHVCYTYTVRGIFHMLISKIQLYTEDVLGLAHNKPLRVAGLTTQLIVMENSALTTYICTHCSRKLNANVKHKNGFIM